jgi:twinkle protein
MGRAIATMPHSCGTSDGLVVFDKGEGQEVDGYCFACGTHVKHPYGEPKKPEQLPKPKIKTPAEIQAELNEIRKYPTVALPDRGLEKEHLDYYKIKMSMSEKDGKTPTASHFPMTKNGKVSGCKVKTIGLEKNKLWSVGDVKETDLVGWRQAISSGARKLIITEGEYDMVAMRQIIHRFHKNNEYVPPAVVSLPHGAGSGPQDLQRLKPHIVKYFNEEDIIFCFDQDDAGQECLEKSMIVYPKAKAAVLPCKDANECITEGREKAAYNATIFKSDTPKNSRIVFAEDVFEQAMKPAEWGELSWPWNHINDVTRGIRYGETIFIGAGVKMGKSELLNALAAHFIEKHGVKVFMAKPEESNVKTYKLLAGKMEGKIFHDPKIEFDKNAFERAHKKLNGKFSAIDIYQHLGWETLKADITYAANWGAKVVFIDPITNLTNGINAAEANTELQKISQDIAALAKDLDIVVFLFCHLKAHDGNISKEARDKLYRDERYIGLGNCPHEMGGDIHSNMFAGSRAMMRSCNYMIGLEGNKDDSLPENIRNIRNLKLLEDREFGEIGKFPLYWQSSTSLFKELET